MNTMTEEIKHKSVMQNECVAHFKECKLTVFFDGTLGAGGHARAILESHDEIEKFIGCDQDFNALKIAEDRLARWKDKLEIVCSNFRDLDQILLERGIKQVDGFFLTWGYHLCN